MIDNAKQDDATAVRFVRGLRRHRFDILLVTLIAIFFSGPVIQALSPPSHPVLTRSVFAAVFIAMLLSAALAVSQSRLTARVAVCLAVPAILTQLLATYVVRAEAIVPSHLLNLAFITYVVAIILRYLFTVDCVSYNTIWASLCGYLLLGILWADIYSLIAYVDPSSFHYTPGVLDVDISRMMRFGSEESAFAIYFSFVTLSTLGYGDIIPATPTARTFAAFEAVAGQMYLAVLVARLVGLHIAGARREGGGMRDER